MGTQTSETRPGRELGAALCSVLLVLSAGCLGLASSGGSPTPEDSPRPTSTDRPAGTAAIDAQGLTLERGESGFLRVEATGVSSMWVGDYPAGEAQVVVDDLAVGFSSEAVVSKPEIDSQEDRYPPVWQWNDVESNVTVEIPVEAGENASLGQYSFEFSAEGDPSGPGSEINDTATVRVVERDEN